ncbi:hypothetical protein [Acinetobacter lwoffii]|uniref:hypothetical protein n=1 Tax=Acinetobacter lwoffii TaxID=28090 RepID=UPI001443F065|nr:hypothetical protein [Acinetobacter lwoffii]NKS46106.1 hypothetical protein [Acinetobacter lwoffii]
MQVHLYIEAVTEEQMQALAQFLKRIDGKKETVRVHLAVLALREALEKAGYKVA